MLCCGLHQFSDSSLLLSCWPVADQACHPPPPFPSQFHLRSAVIRVGQSVDLLGTASGFTRPTIDWWEQDQHDASVNGYGEENCDDIMPADSNLIASCPSGYLTGSPMVEASTETATYHAPMTAGTYHVTLRAFQVQRTPGRGRSGKADHSDDHSYSLKGMQADCRPGVLRRWQ